MIIIISSSSIYIYIYIHTPNLNSQNLEFSCPDSRELLMKTSLMNINDINTIYTINSVIKCINDKNNGTSVV